MKKTAFNYEAAMLEIQQIVQQLQDGKINMDQLAGQATRASALIRQCREHLRDLGNTLDDLFPGEN
jgi:exodeoxyribonuclease VII small subunit